MTVSLRPMADKRLPIPIDVHVCVCAVRALLIKKRVWKMSRRKACRSRSSRSRVKLQLLLLLLLHMKMGTMFKKDTSIRAMTATAFCIFSIF